MFRRMVAIMLGFMLLFTVVSVAEEGDKWILTQYYGGGSVGMFYSIVNQANGTVILVDGGWTANAEQVREVIETNGGKVDYWFLTHYHEDHCGAFNALWPEYKDKIGTVYVTPLTWEEFEPFCHDWDTPETFKTFLKNTEEAENIVALHRGDKIDIKGLQITVFNAYDEEIPARTTDIMNNCSLAFKIENKEKSVLFFGDVGGLSTYLMEIWSTKDLHADYIQAGHHGWGIEIPIYEAIKPEEIFIDAEDSLLNDEYYADKHGVLVQWCKEKGIPMHCFSEAPNRIILK